MRRFTVVLVVVALVAAPITIDVSPPTPDNRVDGTDQSTARSMPDGLPGDIDKATHPTLSDDLAEGPSIQKGASATLDGGVTVYQTTVVVETQPGKEDAVSRAIRAHGGTVEAQISGRVQADLRRRAVTSIADRPDVDFVRKPYYSRSSAVATAGLDDVAATDTHRNGIQGENATVAVVGTSFDANAKSVAGAVVETRSFGSDGFDHPGTHGTAVAQVVASTAPNASIILVEIDTMTEFTQAANWIDQNTHADVAIASLGWPIGPFDGETALGEQLRQGMQNDVQWVLAAGNSGYQGHLRTSWRNSDDDPWLEFAGDDQTAAIRSQNGRVRVTVNWNDWPQSNADYDAYLLAWNGSEWTLADASEITQDGSQPPVETLSAIGANRYQLLIRNYDAEGEATFDVFVNDGARFTEYYDRERSVMRPATVEPALSVGAVAEGTTQLEPFSSRGPTVDGALKPELVAPDRVNTTAYDRLFLGTSAAAPHVAGVAALVVDASDDSLSPQALRSRLLTSARPLGSEPNNRTGHGLVDAESAIDTLDQVTLDDCAGIDAPGRYVLEGNISSTDGDCLEITSGDVIVDANGHTVRSSSAAASVENATNVTLVDARLVGNPPIAATESEVDRRNVTQAVAARKPTASAVEGSASAPRPHLRAKE